MTLFTVKDEHPAAVKAAIGEILPQWLDAFRQLLEIDVGAELGEGNWEGIAVRIAIFNVSQSPHISRCRLRSSSRRGGAIRLSRSS